MKISNKTKVYKFISDQLLRLRLKKTQTENNSKNFNKTLPNCLE